jgi:hypothetical protein
VAEARHPPQGSKTPRNPKGNSETNVLTGNNKWHATTTASGKMTAHDDPSMRHSSGTSGVLTMIMPTIIMNAHKRENQNLLKIFGISLKKFERSTSLMVAAQEMLYENRCARIACETGMARPPKKKKLHRGIKSKGGGKRAVVSMCVYDENPIKNQESKESNRDDIRM